MIKKTIILLTVLLMSTAIPLLAQDETNQDKVICQLASKNCLSQSESIQKRIKKLQKDMAKGKTYSADEVKKLEQKLKEAQDILDKLEGKAPAK
ncbi:MAG: hypothetical protein FD174_4114 [Geobacteraceae bacterium]|nr:MAG: hypothetical protein FD174_4114 [Geobacteraceae bacterium]